MSRCDTSRCETSGPKWIFYIFATMMIFMYMTLPMAFGATSAAPATITPTPNVTAITPHAPATVPPITKDTGGRTPVTPPATTPIPPYDGTRTPPAPPAPTPIPSEVPKPRFDEPTPSPIIELGEGLSLEQTGNKLPSNLPRFDIKTKKPIEWTESFLIRFVINPIFFLAGSIAIMMILYSAARLILSRGQEESLTAAKNTLIWASAGLGLIMVAYTLVNNLTRVIQTLI